MSMLIMHLSQNIDPLIIWYHQPTFEHQESTFIVEICMILFGKLAITVRIPPYKKKIKQAAELRTTLSQQRWGPMKRVTGAT